jgi:hypothetical protein
MVPGLNAVIVLRIQGIRGGAQEYVHRMLALQLVGYLGRARQSLPHDDDFMCVLYVFWKLV